MKVYLLTPANIVTGGCELMHQLADVLNTKTDVSAKIVYFDLNAEMICKAETPEVYKKYTFETETDKNIIDCEDSVVVVPEQNFSLFSQFKKAKKIAWWLSVDAYLLVLEHVYKVPPFDIISGTGLDYFNFKEDESVFHLVQSYYALDFVENEIGVPFKRIEYLSDYVNDVYLENVDIDFSLKENIVAYNPSKGIERLSPIIEATKGEIDFVPIRNMTPVEVKDLLLRAKVYIDFGHHPGKDRIPREAALCGCAVITNKMGAAGFAKDVPIPEKYKIENDDIKTIDLIKDIFNDFEFHSFAFLEYIEMIRAEKEKFINDAIKVFGEMLKDKNGWGR